MNLHRYHSSSLAYLFSLVCMALFVCSLTSACTAGQRQDTLRTTLTGLNAARNGFTTWDAKHQRDIVDQAQTRDDAAKALSDYRSGTQAKVSTGFELAYQSVAVAATQTDQLSLDAAIKQGADLIALIKQIMGVP